MDDPEGANRQSGKERSLSVASVLIVCIGLAVASIAAVGFGFSDQLIQSVPNGPEPTGSAAAGVPGPPVGGQAADTVPGEKASAEPEPHRAIYRDGKLILRGAVPSEEISAAFEQKASEVIGADNVINRYVIDPRADEPTDGRVIVDEPFLFAFDSADVDPQFFSLLDLGVLVMDLNPQARMRVIGHTDSTGTELYNEGLSLARAVAVADYLTAHGITSDRIVVRGHGERRPIAGNITAEGRSLNRRIEIELLDLLS